MSREFLVRRLMEDSERQARMPCSDEQSESSEQSGSVGKPSPKSGDIPASYNMPLGPFGAGSPLQYAALAHLAGMNFFQPSASLSPLVYPHLFQSLVALPNLDRIRRAVQTSAATPTKPSPPPTTAVTEPAVTGKTGIEGQKRPVTSPKRRSGGKKLTTVADINNVTPRKKAARKLSFDDETASPVSGMKFYYKDDMTAILTAFPF